ncbi:MAG: hypothetical protein F4129_14590, partial [Acidimicrobiia bacterium]|nr:hypothetical protein [Acidimicrobiia bacterium]
MTVWLPIRRSGLALALLASVLALAPWPVSAQSGSVPATPARPVIDSVAHDSVTLSWADPGDSTITGYQILRRHRATQPAGVFSVIEDDTGSAATSYTDTTVEASTSYVYRIKARNAHGLSLRSVYRRADTPAAPPEPQIQTETDDSDSAGTTIALAAANQASRGVWSDGTTVWVADSSQDKIYAYSLADGSRDATKDIDDLNAAGANHPRGIWSNGTTLWVADGGDDKAFAYSLADGSRDATKDINGLDAAGNNRPMGIWSDGTTLWVADDGQDKVFAYDLATGSRDASKEIDDLDASGNAHSRGIWSNGTTLWVADSGDDKVYAYSLADGSRDATKDIDSL